MNARESSSFEYATSIKSSQIKIDFLLGGNTFSSFKDFGIPSINVISNNDESSSYNTKMELKPTRAEQTKSSRTELQLDYFDDVFHTFLGLDSVIYYAVNGTVTSLLVFIQNIFNCVPRTNKAFTGLDRHGGK